MKEIFRRSPTSKLLLTEPCSIEFEKYCFKTYEATISYIIENLNQVSTLEEDLKLLEHNPNRKPLSANFRMAVVYRSEKKKILRS